MNDYSFRTAFVLGFHGCDAATAQRIFSGKSSHLKASENRYDWLGSGIYFWEGSAARAMSWAEERMKRPGPGKSMIRKPAVIGAVIDLGNCLDLLDSQYFDLVRNAYPALENVMRAAGLLMPQNKTLENNTDPLFRELDCSVVNFIHEMRETRKLPPFDTVRSAFFEGEPLYKDAGFRDKNHIQISVRNTQCIKGYFRPILARD